MKESELNKVYTLLTFEVNRTVEELKSVTDLETKASLIEYKNQIDYSLSLLKKCEEFDIRPSSIFNKLPIQKTRTPSSDYRIVEDHETDDQNYWTEVDFDLRLHEGDVIIET